VSTETVILRLDLPPGADRGAKDLGKVKTVTFQPGTHSSCLWEAEIGRITVRGQPGKIAHKTLFPK
jgi:hypothetical protein